VLAAELRQVARAHYTGLHPDLAYLGYYNHERADTGWLAKGRTAADWSMVLARCPR